jgi:hypothetical protein
MRQTTIIIFVTGLVLGFGLIIALDSVFNGEPINPYAYIVTILSLAAAAIYGQFTIRTLDRWS